MSDAGGLLAVLVLVAANGFFVAAEFSLVAVRRSRVIELAASGRINAKALVRALDHLDSNLAATQLGITISSLALGWIGEPAIAHLIEEPLARLWGTTAGVSAYAIAVGISFLLITALHIVLGELAPKSLALQRSEGTALWVVRPLSLFRWLLSPAILVLNGMGNLVLRLCGLRPGTGEESLHSPGELKLLVEASQDAGLLQDAQEEVMVRALEIGNRRIGEIMTPRTELDWIDTSDGPDEIVRTVLESPYEQMLVGQGSIDNLLGAVTKTDLLNQLLRGGAIDPGAVIAVPLMVHEAMPIFKVLELFKKSPVRLAVVVDEYGGIEGIVTQADLLEALAGDIPEVLGEGPDVVERQDGSLLIDGMAPVHATLDRLKLDKLPVSTRFHTIAGFALAQLGHLPVAGEQFTYEDWTFEIVDMDGRRIDKLLARRTPTLEA
ncbi:hemolysin family protein [Reyranella sp.]|jgi:CBS domain containing-hemolysin-like protein|uniref:hemolysin family protein n=1 Tax=Reyranella sp. TaxID=1929291 RepID=UPI000BD5D668|nr:hemolysin family protein [Reyranella sp.]OYY44071.1 MAG: hemolysin [Rhodospirillales bacterium 35-66-84]OYZ94747.1 MAG: hemolysin [Rhodospirillales bacterium 24-66-33]OZB26179.1 MAG: hemolysin [Rhodospirillales bacterium 39-66-50]HQS15107.1 hemolysin family protein [Reyranella sp.]HQT10916.1 hemolysin family protein [Reyranella sp.]